MQYIGIVRNPEPQDSEESSTDHVKILQNQPSLRSTRRAGFYGIKKRKKRTFVVQEEKRRRRRAALFVLPARDVVSFVLRVSRLGGVVRGARVIPVVAQFVCFAKLRRVFVCAVAHGFILHGAPGFDDGESEGIAGAVLAGRDGERVPRPVRGGHLDTLVVPPVPAVPSGGAPDELHPAHGPRHVAVPHLVGNTAQVHGEGDGRCARAQPGVGSRFQVRDLDGGGGHAEHLAHVRGRHRGDDKHRARGDPKQPQSLGFKAGGLGGYIRLRPRNQGNRLRVLRGHGESRASNVRGGM